MSMTVVPTSVARVVVGEDPLVVRVLVPGEEVAGAGRDVDPVAIDRDPEWVTGRRSTREDRDVPECPMARIRRQDAAARPEDAGRKDGAHAGGHPPRTRVGWA